MSARSAADRLLRDAGPTVSIPEAARVLGVSRGTGYALARRGEFPTRLLKLGAQWRVPTADLRALVGIEDADA